PLLARGHSTVDSFADLKVGPPSGRRPAVHGGENPIRTAVPGYYPFPLIVSPLRSLGVIQGGHGQSHSILHAGAKPNRVRLLRPWVCWGQSLTPPATCDAPSS